MHFIQTDYRGLAHAGQEGLPLRLHSGVVAIGNFDGVHLGHQALLKRERALADEKNMPLLALTFSPHPRRFFQADQPPFLLSDSILRRDYLEQAGVDAVVELTFDGVLARTSAEDFIREILVNALQAKHIVVGENFQFGAGRTGDVKLLKEMGKKHGFEVTALPLMKDIDGKRLSSEQVRAAIRNGHMATAEQLLGRPWQTRGEVIRGDQRGRQWGFPTANMVLQEFLAPKYGVYSARVQVEPEGQWFNAVMNFGIRPNFILPFPLLEAHIFDFADNLYGKTLRVEWRDFMRPEKRFASTDLLKKQIAEDVKRARELLEAVIS
jgi:riboflavin kinase/FMN adenylyltransferase